MLASLTQGAHRGQTRTLPATAVTKDAPLEVRTVAVTVALVGGGADHSGAAIAHKGNDGFWMTDDTTGGAGTSSLQLLNGSYTFRADFHGQPTLGDATDVSGSTTANFPLTTVTVGAGESAAAVEHRANNGEWTSDGTADAKGAVIDGVKRFQLRHGLEPDAVLGRGTQAALGVPLAWRVRQIELALERSARRARYRY